jgi:2-dehydro-3-deoxyphosphogluconate aldolase/(4S)-4-hydroxy-2-oxoglutarate aldolase
LAKALVDGGLPCAEVTFRTAAAEESIRLMREAYPDMLIGAGTVLTTEQVDKAVAAGATFIVSPGLNPKIVRYCIEKDIPITPGCANPSDVEAAIELGLEVVKFFPAEAAGGLAMIKAMAAPYVNMKFMPTGGINAKNLVSYLDFSKIIACGGSWMVTDELVKAGEFDKITTLTKEAVALMLGFEIRHVGINMPNEAEADTVADQFGEAFGFAKNAGNSSIFMGTGIELMKEPYLGKMGHIAIQTNYIDRAIYHLEKKGFALKEDSKKYKNDKLVAVYLKQEFGGFAVHLLQK